MFNKEALRIKYLKLRKKKYFEVTESYFDPLLIILKKILKKKEFNLALYYPSNYEVNVIKFHNIIKSKKNISVLLPLISINSNLKFYKWEYLDPLKVNKFGILEPLRINKSLIPNVALIPLLAFDRQNNRLGYGKGYYDKFLGKYLKKNINIITIGVAFSFQKYDKLPTTQLDIKLDYILTEKGITKI